MLFNTKFTPTRLRSLAAWRCRADAAATRVIFVIYLFPYYMVYTIHFWYIAVFMLYKLF